MSRNGRNTNHCQRYGSHVQLTVLMDSGCAAFGQNRHVRTGLWRDEMQREAAAAKRAALEKARAEQLKRASVDERLRACAPLYREHGWIVRPPRKQK